MDVWDVNSFDSDLRRVLDEHAELIRGYVTTDKRIFLERDHNDGPDRPVLRPDNPYAGRFHSLEKMLDDLLQSRTIRAWHYARLTDEEMDVIREDGIRLSTPQTLRERLDRLVSLGLIGAALADDLFRESPFQGDQREARSNAFWLTSHPKCITDSGVTRLLQYWGGEVASFWTDDEALLDPIRAIGRPRVLEVAVPLSSTKHRYRAARAMLAAYSRAIGCVESSHGCDVCVVSPLPGSAIITVHTDGNNSFTAIGRTYPSNFVDVDRGYWKELTGEED